MDPFLVIFVLSFDSENSGSVRKLRDSQQKEESRPHKERTKMEILHSNSAFKFVNRKRNANNALKEN
jgi:hypothetical protein